MRAHEEPAPRTVERLPAAPCVALVYYPGLADRLRREVALRTRLRLPVGIQHAEGLAEDLRRH
jgi:hypothetical protein